MNSPGRIVLPRLARFKAIHHIEAEIRRRGMILLATCGTATKLAGIAPGISPRRTRMVVPGPAILEALRKTRPADRVLAADRGQREGMLLRQIRGARRERIACPRPA